jgi:protein-S-isoprenylcysteine O-methyltransferase Ste14
VNTPETIRSAFVGRETRFEGRSVVPAPLLYLAGIVGGWLLQHLRPLPIVARLPGMWLGALLVAGGITVGLSGFLECRRCRTSVRPDRPSATIVSTGIFRHTRNPMYLGFAIVQLGAALLVNSAWVLLLLVPAMLVTTSIITREEMYMERRFGEAYLAYKASVRRWI